MTDAAPASNFFDQFDNPAPAPVDTTGTDGANYFDQFDNPTTASKEPSAPQMTGVIRKPAMAASDFAEGAVGGTLGLGEMVARALHQLSPKALAETVGAWKAGQSNPNNALATPETDKVLGYLKSEGLIDRPDLQPQAGTTEPYLAEASKVAGGALPFALSDGVVGGAKVLGSGVVSGLAGEAASQAIPGNKIAKALAEIGGFTAPTALKSLVSMGARAVAPLTESARRNAVAEILEGQTGQSRDQMASNLADAQANAPDVDGLMYPTGNLLDDPSLQGLQRGFQGTDTGLNAKVTANRTQAAADALTAERPTGTPAVARATLEGQRDDLTGAVDQAKQDRADAIQAAQDQGAADLAAQQTAGGQRIAGASQAASDALVPGTLPDKTAASNTARNEVVQAEADAKAPFEQRYAEVDPENVTQADSLPIRNAIDQVKVEQSHPLADPDNTPRFIATGQADKLPAVLSADDLKILKSNIGNQLGQAAQSGNRQLTRHLSTIMDGINQVYEEIGAGRPLARETQAADDALGAGSSPGAVAAELPRANILDAAQAENVQQPLNAELQATGTTGRVRVDAPTDSSAGASVRGISAPGEQSAQNAGGQESVAASGGTGEIPGQSPDVPVLPQSETPFRYDPGVAERARAVASDFKTQVVQRFRQGNIADILKNGSDGIPRIEPSRTLQRIVKPDAQGGKEAIADYIRAVGDRPAAIQAAHDWAVRDIADFATNADGKLSGIKLAQWKAKYASVLKAMPELAERLGNVRDLTGQVDKVTAEHATNMDAIKQQTGEQVQGAKIAGTKAVQTAQRSVADLKHSAAKFWLDADPTEAATATLNSRDPVMAVKQITQRLDGHPDAIDGFRRGIYDAVEAKLNNFAGGPSGVNKTLDEFFNRSRPAMVEALGVQKAARAEEILRGLKLAKSHQGVPARSGSTTAQYASEDQVAQAMAQQAVGRGIGKIIDSVPFVKELYGHMTANARGKVDALLKQSLFDPDTARLVFNTPVSQGTVRSVAKRLASSLRAAIPVATTQSALAH